jgi:hypothetical protein
MDLGFDFGQLAIGGVLLVPLVVGLVQISRKLGVKDNWLILEAFGLADLFGMIAYGINEGLIPAPVVPWVTMVFVGLGCGVVGLSASGLVSLGKQAVVQWAAFGPDEAHAPRGGR